MKNLTTLFIAFWFFLSAFSQTQIASSNHSGATYGHNQRKIVRDFQDNIYVVYTDIVDSDIVVYGIRYDNAAEEWGSANFLISGNAPTLAIDQNDKIMMVYKTNDPEPLIKTISTYDFTEWTEPLTLSFDGFAAEMPVADVDSANVLNVLWMDYEMQTDSTRLCYAGVIEDTLIEKKMILKRFQITDVGIANHLQYEANHLFFTIASENMQLEYFLTNNYFETFDLVYENEGSFPCITYNSAIPNSPYVENLIRFIMIRPDFYQGLTEVEADVPAFTFPIEHNMSQFNADYLCVDNVAPPTGYSFIYQDDETLNHVFSFGAMYNWSTTMSSYTANSSLFYPNIAYKHFNPLFVDFIWMETAGSNYNIMYRRDDKYLSIPGVFDEDAGKGFLLTGKPNPFSEFIELKVFVEENSNKQSPQLEIFNIQSQKIATLSPFEQGASNNTGQTLFRYRWDGSTLSGATAEPGIYLVRCTYKDKRVVRKIVFEP